VVRERKDLEGLAGVNAAIDSVRTKLGKEGRAFVRYSGTEPKVRILIEGPDKARNEEHAQTIAAALTAALG